MLTCKALAVLAAVAGAAAIVDVGNRIPCIRKLLTVKVDSWIRDHLEVLQTHQAAAGQPACA